MTQKPNPNNTKKTAAAGGYQSPLSKLFSRQQPKVNAKKGMAQLLLTYAENDTKRIADLLNAWMSENQQ